MTTQVLSFVADPPWIKDVIAEALLEMPFETFQDPEKRLYFIIDRIRKAWENVNAVIALD